VAIGISVNTRFPVSDNKLIVDEQFSARFDVAKCENEHATSDLFGLTVERATMIDPARRVPTLHTVDHPPIVEIEERGMSIFRGRSLVSALRFSPGQSLSLVLEQLLAGTDPVTAKTLRP
jgi:hypothetical protein